MTHPAETFSVLYPTIWFSILEATPLAAQRYRRSHCENPHLPPAVRLVRTDHQAPGKITVLLSGFSKVASTRQLNQPHHHHHLFQHASAPAHHPFLGPFRHRFRLRRLLRLISRGLERSRRRVRGHARRVAPSGPWAAWFDSAEDNHFPSIEISTAPTFSTAKSASRAFIFPTISITVICPFAKRAPSTTTDTPLRSRHHLTVTTTLNHRVRYDYPKRFSRWRTYTSRTLVRPSRRFRKSSSVSCRLRRSRT